MVPKTAYCIYGTLWTIVLLAARYDTHLISIDNLKTIDVDQEETSENIISALLVASGGKNMAAKNKKQ